MNLRKKNGKAKVYYFLGKDNSDSYRNEKGINSETIRNEISNSGGQLAAEMSSYLYLIAADLVPPNGSTKPTVCGQADYLLEPPWWDFWSGPAGPWAVVDVSPNCFYSIHETDLNEEGWRRRVWITAHELGHAFGLQHNFQDSTYLMSYGGSCNGKLLPPNKLSSCAAKWLEASRFFNNAFIIAQDQEAEIEFVSKPVYVQNTDELHLQFVIRDADGLHQAHLGVAQKNTPPGFSTECQTIKGASTRDERWQNFNGKLALYDCKSLKWPTETIQFTYLKLTENPLDNPKIQLQVIDLQGNITKKEFTLDPDEIVLKNVSEATSPIVNQTLQTGNSSQSSNVNNVVQDARLRATLTGHTDFVSSVAFFP